MNIWLRVVILSVAILATSTSTHGNGYSFGYGNGYTKSGYGYGKGIQVGNGYGKGQVKSGFGARRGQGYPYYEVRPITKKEGRQYVEAYNEASQEWQEAREAQSNDNHIWILFVVMYIMSTFGVFTALG